MTDMEMLYEVLKPRVDAGVEWLDANAPAGWWDLIDYDTLDVSDGNVCILGQVFAAQAAEAGFIAGYLYAEDTFDLGPHGERKLPVIALGFCGSPFEYDMLRDIWIDAVEDRRALLSH